MEHIIIKKNIAIAALARNCEKNLPLNIERIEKLRTHFTKSYVFIYENDSTDSTVDLLNNWAKQYDHVYIKCEHLDLKNQKSTTSRRIYRGVNIKRISRMSECRNNLLEMIKNICEPDYVLFIDSDILSFSVDGILSAIKKAQDINWGALFANCYMTYSVNNQTDTFAIYYDTFAYVAQNRNIQDIRPFEISPIYRFFLSKKLFKLIQQNDFFQCSSAFGGIAIYKYNNLKEQDYKPIIPQKWEKLGIALCEHVSVNQNINNPKYISRDIEVCYANYQCKGIKGWILKKLPTFYVFIGIIYDIIRK